MFADIKTRIVESNKNEYLGKTKIINNISPLVTVDVITYQQVEFIKDCLDSILMQKTKFKIEINIGEDGSTDGTREICIKYAEKHPDKIRLFLRDRKDVIYWNNIPSATFNALANMAVARGKYVAICEGDDYWLDSYKLQKQVDYIENNYGCTMCTHAAYIIDTSGAVIREKRPSVGDKIYSVKDAIIGGNREATSSFLYLRSVIDPPKWDIASAINPSSDTPLYLLCAYHGFVGYIDEFMSVYRKGALFSISSAIKHTRDMQIFAAKGKISVYEAFDEYTNGIYGSLIAKRIMHYIKVMLKKAEIKKIFFNLRICDTINNFPLKERFYAYILLMILFPYYQLKRLIKKIS